MNKIEITIEYYEYQFEELSIEEQELINQSKIARENAYAPNSNFKVGAALKLDNGEFILGNNQTNDYNEIIKPCGGCLQVLVEYESKQTTAIDIYLYSNDGRVWKTTGVKNLLPLMFKF